jgi:ABC-type nitrate/sulfonate/bicarbonate transport system substrate-binding protein
MDDRYGASLYEIEIGIVVPAVIYAPVWLAEQRGFLRDEGLTVRLRSFGSAEGTTAALRDGIVPVTIGSPEGSILNALGGGDLRLVSGFVNRQHRGRTLAQGGRDIHWQDQRAGIRFGLAHLQSGVRRNTQCL